MHIDITRRTNMTFAGLSSQEYIAKKSIGNLSESYTEIQQIKKYLKNLYEKNLIVGFEYMFV